MLPILNLLIFIVLVGLAFYAIWWFLGVVGLPDPFNKIIQVLVALVALIIVLSLLFGGLKAPVWIS